MTTIDAAAAWRGNKSVVFAVFAAFIGLGLGGCETGANLFASNDDANSLSITGQPPATTGQTAKIAIAPVIGAPDTVARQLETQLASAIEAQRISVAKDPNAKAEFTLRGYIVSAREKGRTKVSYIWDVTDPTGKRVNRITGEEVLTGAQSKDPWTSVTPQVVNTISSKTAGSLVTWLPSQSAAAIAMGTPAAGGQQAAPSAAPTAYSAAGSSASVSPAAAGGPATTGSIARDGGVTAMVPSVVGAPGDGSVALTSAIQRELTRSGVALTETPSAQTYKVEGKVVVGQGQNGKQPIQIDWEVKDPQGKKLGTVSQKNEIPQGSLDGAWGKTADAAASAAAQGIVKLLPQQTKVN
ncbi:hypothetical protein [Hyphomicrobium sp.]|uniref:hypothetical protein n=1 Tax=Hyphomicrobium sp. TaxID=82 RepID=UPI0025B82B4F|nr:hypothetical protein [Hyphomicrobium sp.]MCC7251172.1 hypothetical protein [Hyphomicrobium sp.]